MKTQPSVCITPDREVTQPDSRLYHWDVAPAPVTGCLSNTPHGSAVTPPIDTPRVSAHRQLQRAVTPAVCTSSHEAPRGSLHRGLSGTLHPCPSRAVTPGSLRPTPPLSLAYRYTGSGVWRRDGRVPRGRPSLARPDKVSAERAAVGRLRPRRRPRSARQQWRRPCGAGTSHCRPRSTPEMTTGEHALCAV